MAGILRREVASNSINILTKANFYRWKDEINLQDSRVHEKLNNNKRVKNKRVGLPTTRLQFINHGFTLQSMWKLVVAQMCHLSAAHQKWDRTDVPSVKLAEAYNVV
ncbi:hypothetical protein ACROYT_G027744 [Oculina patagonica]